MGDLGPTLKLLADQLDGKLPNAGACSTCASTSSTTSPTGRRGPVPVRRRRPRARRAPGDPEDGIVCLDKGMYKIWFARNYRTYVANTLLLDNALATMGAGLPSAMMAAMLLPNRRVMARVCGDGGFMMNSRRWRPRSASSSTSWCWCWDDSAYGMIRWKQAVDKFADYGMTFSNPDFVLYAKSYGAPRPRGRVGQRPRADPRPGLRGGRASTSWRCRSTIPETPAACWSTSCAQGEGFRAGRVRLVAGWVGDQDRAAR